MISKSGGEVGVRGDVKLALAFSARLRAFMWPTIFCEAIIQWVIAPSNLGTTELMHYICT